MEILEYFPLHIKNELSKYINSNKIEEIRIRNQRPIVFKFNNGLVKTEYIVKTEDILEIMQKITENSLYSYQKQISEGYITLKGGHRVGISGNVVMENEKVININYIYSLNFRIARQIKGCSNKVLRYIIDIENNTIYNTIIVSPPGAGKTTILRDAVRKISNGIENIGLPRNECWYD